MLKTMRSTVGKVVTIILFSLLILSFAVWGIGDIFRGPGINTAVATVGDRDISATDFSRVLQQEVNRTQQILGRTLDGQQIREFGVAANALNRLITQASVAELADDMGMTVTEEQLQQAIRENPAFQGPDGQFDPNLVRQTLFANNLGEAAYLELLRNTIASQQLLDASFAGLSSPDVMVQALYAFENETRSAQYVTVYQNAFSDIADPEAVALQAYYEEVKESFKSPEYRALTYIRFSAEDLMDEVAVSDEEVREEYDLRQANYTTPETRDITQVVVSDPEMAEQLIQRANEGLTLAAAAEALGMPAPVDLGTVAQNTLPAAIGEAAFAADEGAVVGPVATPLGQHVLLINSVQPGGAQEFDEVRNELETEIKRARAIDGLFTLANELDDTIAGGATLEEAAGQLDLPVTTVAAVDRSGRGQDRQPVDRLGARSPILAEAFQLEPGGESLLTETDDDGYFVVRVDNVIPEAVQPLDEVRDRVVRRWKQDERARLAKELAEEIKTKAEEGLSLEAAIDEVELPDGITLAVESTEGVLRNERDQQKVPSPQFATTLFQMDEGEVRTAAGPLSEIVLTVTAISTPDATDQEALDDLEAVLLGGIQSDLSDQLLQALRDDLGVSINNQQIDLLLENYL